MKVLVMGGTRFNGLALVQELVKWGHEVTVLNRGQSEARLPRPVRRLYADRTNHEQLREVLGREEFDVVQDLSGYALADVQPLVEVFRGRIGHYLFGSSTVIYARPRVLPIRESDPVDRSERQTEYGQQKLNVEAYLFDQYRSERLPGHRGPALDGARPEQHGRRPRAAHVPAAAARPPGAHPRRRHHAEPDRARRRRRRRPAHADDAAADVRQALQPDRPRLLERRGLRRHLRRDHRRHPAQGLRPGPGHGRHLRGQGRPERRSARACPP